MWSKHITNPKPWLLYWCLWIAKFSLKLCHWKINENDCKVASKSYCCLASTRTFPGSHLSKNYLIGNTADYYNFFSRSTVDFKMQTLHTVRLELTATPQAGIFFTATLHKRMRNTANPQRPPLLCMSHTFNLTGYQLQCAVVQPANRLS